jgi:hydrogenase-4 component B
LQAENVKALSFSMLPVLALVIPALGAILVALAGEKRARLRNWTAVAASGITLGLVVWMLAKVFSGGAVYFNLDIMRIGDRFVGNLEVDALGAFFAFFAAVLWFAACLHSFKYMDHEHKRTRFYFFLLLCEAATLGVFMVQDFFTLYLFFEAMGLIAYVLVVHSETQKARSAATKYIILTVIGGMVLLGGILLYLGASGTVSFAPLAESSWLTGSFKVVALIALIAGFGVKAGMVPLHVWLPDAHPAAPSPASALLSGVMIKVGAYGILRVVLTFFQQPLEAEAPVTGAAGHGAAVAHAAQGAGHAASGLAGNVQMLGFAIIVIAVATMLAGMVMALVQRDIKRTLAYSSISQMGFILFGVGCLAFLGGEGAMGMAGSLYHVINHAFFKGCFFLAAGSILFCAHELDMFKLGGLWRRMPFTTIFWSMAALGIMGITLFNGFVSKTLLHHAIIESHDLAVGAHLATAGWVKAAEILFIITSAGTIAYILKMTYYVFFRRPTEEQRAHLDKVKEAPSWMLAGTGLLAAGVLFLGLFPGLILSRLIGPTAGTVPGLSPELVDHVAHIPIFIWGNIKEIIIPVLLGVTVFLIGAWPDLFAVKRRGPDIFAIRLPSQLGVDYWYTQAAKDSLATLFAGRSAYAAFKQRIGLAMGSLAPVLSLLKPAAAKAVPESRIGARIFSPLLAAGDYYALVKRRSLAALASEGKSLRAMAARAMAGEANWFSRDLALGTLAITVVLVALLIFRLV